MRDDARRHISGGRGFGSHGAGYGLAPWQQSRCFDRRRPEYEQQHKTAGDGKCLASLSLRERATASSRPN